MILSFHPCFDADRQVILGDRALRPEYVEWISRSDAIILPQSCSEDLYRRCVRSGAAVFPNYVKRFEFPGKIGQSALFEQMGFPHPETKRWTCVEEFRRAQGNAKTAPHPFPFLIKEDRSHEGDGIYLIEGRESLRSALQELSRKEKSKQIGFVTQVFVPNHGNVFRTVVIGRYLTTYWKRFSRSAQPIVSLSKGARLDHKWRPDLQQKGKEAAEDFARATGINLAAIDSLFPLGREAEPLFLEVNYYFGRRGLGGTLVYYRQVHGAIQEWLAEKGLNPEAVRLV
jgi:ribosomal protein S6--L-glutamate ligase